VNDTGETAQIIAAQGVDLDLEEGDLVAGVVVIAKVVTADGGVTVNLGSSEGMTWLDQLGLLVAANDIVRPGSYEHEGD
jgi:hypothetical protein